MGLSSILRALSAYVTASGSYEDDTSSRVWCFEWNLALNELLTHITKVF